MPPKASWISHGRSQRRFELLTTLIAVVIAAQAQGGQVPQAAPTETAVQIVEKMLAKYAGATTLTGTVSFVQSAEGRSIKSETQLQYEKPSKIYLRQIFQSSSEQRDLMLVSDGTVFTYDKPEGTLGRPRFRENVTQNRRQQTIQELYTAERLSLVDRSPLIDIAIGRTQDLRDVLGQWANMKVHSVVKLKDREIEATAIVGNYRDNADAPLSGNFEIYITSDYEVVRYVTKYVTLVTTDKGQRNVEVQTIWDSTLKVNSKVDPALFRVLK